MLHCNMQLHQHCKTAAVVLFSTPVAIPAHGGLTPDAHTPFLPPAMRRATQFQRAELPALFTAELCVAHVAQLFVQDAVQRRVQGAQLLRHACFRSATTGRLVNAAGSAASCTPRVCRSCAPPSAYSYLKLITLNVSHRVRHHTSRLKSPAERPRRGMCRRVHVSRRCT